MTPVLLIPGIHNSGPAHWQSLWQAAHPGFARVPQRDWDHPRAADWVAAIDEAVAACTAPPVLVAHSLGCLALAHWCAGSPRPVAGVLLVALPDPAGPHFPAEATGFALPPPSLGGRRCVLVTGTDDPYGNPTQAAACAQAWQAAHHVLPGAGHINAASGLGDWPWGWALVQGLRGPAVAA